MALIDKEKTFKLFHASAIFSPIYSINSTVSCTDYTTNITFNDLGFILFKRTGEKLDIQMEFIPNAQNEAGEKNPISKDSNIQFYFYKNYVNVFFFDLAGDFLMRTLILPDRMFANFEDSTKIQFDHQTSDTSCNDVVKLFVGNGVKILLPKYVKPTSPKAPTNPPTVPPPIISTTKIKEKASTASFPMEAIIAISCFFGIIFLGAFIFAIYYCIKKHKKRKNPKTPPTMMLDPSISMLEHEMASKKSKNNNILIDVPDSSKKLKDDIQILAGEPTNSVTPKKSTIECIVNGRLPFFFYGLTKCKHCNDANFKPRFFNSSSRLSECLRELPLGHHILAQYGNGKNFKDS
uniref:Uncharacterized protein n=1 Tax=Panagrolaimus sp. ES5 TaxID=591445 RepID=A0AC34FDY2_9BILA